MPLLAFVAGGGLALVWDGHELLAQDAFVNTNGLRPLLEVSLAISYRTVVFSGLPASGNHGLRRCVRAPCCSIRLLGHQSPGLGLTGEVD